MTRVHIICEGATEETFIQELIDAHLSSKGVYVTATLIGKPGHKGGNVSFQRLLTDLRARLLGDRTAYSTTLFDYYGLPSDFPGKTDAAHQMGIAAKARSVEDALVAELARHLPGPALDRFIPYVQMHEFEGLLFSAPDKLANILGRENAASQLQNIRNKFSSPEDINDSVFTAPSKRIEQIFPGYDKPVAGTLAALEIGLDIMRAECKLFDSWLRKIETLGLQTG